MELILPNNGWRPRDYQMPLWRYLRNGGTRALAVWHRRSGKDEIALHHTACAAMERVGTYWHMLPEASQARKAIWEAVNPHTGKRRIDEAFPHIMRATTRENEMFIKFVNGSTWQVLGSDNFNSLVGSPPVGIVCSEWALCDPTSWAYLRPILAENGGWGLFITTPRGKNHCWHMLESAKQEPDWFSEVLGVDKTKAIKKSVIDQERRELIREYGETQGLAMFRQEYYAAFENAIVGSYYGEIMEAALTGGRITRVPASPDLPVYTGWDIGHSDSTSIWFSQMVGREPHIVDYYQNNGQKLAHYMKVVNERGYTYGRHFLPHDAGHRTFQTGMSVEELMIEAGWEQRDITVLGKTDIEAGIEQTRQLISLAYFDVDKCSQGISALKEYKKQWDKKKQRFMDKPYHDWASDPSDAFRYLAVGLQSERPYVAKKVQTDYSMGVIPNSHGWMA